MSMRWSPLLLLVLLVPDVSPAQEERPPAIRHTIDVDAEDEPLAEVAARIGHQAGRTIVVDPELDEAITLSLVRIGWRDALAVVAELARCELQELPSGVLLLTRPTRITISCHDADLQTVLLLLARYAGRSIVISPKVQGSVTVQLRNVRPLAALRAIAQTAGDFVVVGAGSGVEVDAGPAASERVAERPPTDVLDGRLVALEGDTLILQVTTAGQATPARVGLPRNAALRVTLARARPGDRLVLTCDRQGGERVARSVIAPAR